MGFGVVAGVVVRKALAQAGILLSAEGDAARTL
jgi:hypothetical protein